MTRRLAAAFVGLALLTFAVVWAVVHYSFIYIGERGFEMVEMVEKPILVPVSGVERIRIALQMVYGDLHLSSGTVGLLTGTARFNVAEFAPYILYEEEGDRGRLLVQHFQDADPTKLINRAGRINEWELVLNDQLTIDELEVVVGLGSGHLDLRGVNLRYGSLDLVAGDFTVDLRGPRTQRSVMRIEGVTGTITVLLPNETGALVMMDNVPRTLHITGLEQLATAPAPESLPAMPDQEWEAAGENNAEDKAEEHEYDYYVPDSLYYANSAYAEGAANLYLQVSDAFGTLNLVVEGQAQE